MPAPVQQRILDVPASRIRAVTQAGEGLAGLIPLWFGEGDEVTPQFIRDAAAAALARGETFYGPNRGIPELREAIRRYTRRIYGADIDLERISITASGMNGLMIAIQCLVGPGDGAIVVGPVWPNGQEAIAAMGGSVRRIDLDRQSDGSRRLDLDRLIDACDDGTRLIVVNSPNNPTGWVASKEELGQLLALARARRIWLLADEVYNRITRDGRPAPSLIDLAAPEDPVVIVNSFSKSWSMTGWRLGWVVLPPSLAPIYAKMTEYNISHPTTFAQWGAVAALDHGDYYVESLVARYRTAGDLVRQRLSGLPRVLLSRADGAFYAFFGVDGVGDSFAFARELLERTRVGLAPGSAFGPSGEGYLRLCFATSLPKLSEALDRLAPALL
jgi:aspartate aminotransferase